VPEPETNVHAIPVIDTSVGGDGAAPGAVIGADDLRALVDRLPEAIVAVDDELNVVFFNRAARRFFHPDPLRGGSPLPAERLGSDGAGFVRGLHARRARPVERLCETDGRSFRLHGFPMRDRAFATVVIEDISNARRRDVAKEDFVANAAHELLTPLTGIVSAAHVLESGAKEVPEIRDRFLGHISRDCSRLVRICRGLLTLARAQSSEEPPRPEVVALKPLLSDAVAAAGDASRVTVDCPPGIAVFVDRDLVETAIANLLANAARHSPDSDVAISVEEAGARVHVVVSDSGAGIAPRDLARLQRRFTTGGGRDGGGFGLGVSIAAEAIAAVGGTLTYLSGAGGSRVRVELPRDRR
jgi:signal transduction histidine kinase